MKIFSNIFFHIPNNQKPRLLSIGRKMPSRSQGYSCMDEWEKYRFDSDVIYLS